MFFASTGSREGSSSSFTFSIMQGVPNSIARSSVRMNPDVFGSKIFSPCGASIFLIHLLPWFCGSIISAKRLPRVTRMPFSVENASVGRPCTFQVLTAAGSAKKSTKLKPSVTGISYSRTGLTHFSSTRTWRYFAPKGPAYDKNAAAIATSPYRFPKSMSNLPSDSSHLIFSPARPFTSLSARSALIFKSSAVCVISSFSRVELSYKSFRSCTVFCTSASCSFAFSRNSNFFSSAVCASFSFSRFGSTSRETAA
mmetsp:Transcript_16730/g.41426  ORF Transcript_16730/g.41426 Transcript_16730/m.41426 type:complete len:254 (+) Transcript_16730:3416-4177(+)